MKRERLTPTDIHRYASVNENTELSDEEAEKVFAHAAGLEFAVRDHMDGLIDRDTAMIALNEARRLAPVIQTWELLRQVERVWVVLGSRDRAALGAYAARRGFGQGDEGGRALLAGYFVHMLSGVLRSYEAPVPDAMEDVSVLLAVPILRSIGDSMSQPGHAGPVLEEWMKAQQ